MDENYTPSNDKSIDCAEFFTHWGVNRPFDGGLFDRKDLVGIDPHHIWTIVNDDDGGELALPGIRHVNVIGFLTTDRPWTSKDLWVRYWAPHEDENFTDEQVIGPVPA